MPPGSSLPSDHLCNRLQLYFLLHKKKSSSDRLLECGSLLSAVNQFSKPFSPKEHASSFHILHLLSQHLSCQSAGAEIVLFTLAAGGNISDTRASAAEIDKKMLNIGRLLSHGFSLRVKKVQNQTVCIQKPAPGKLLN